MINNERPLRRPILPSHHHRRFTTETRQAQDANESSTEMPPEQIVQYRASLGDGQREHRASSFSNGEVITIHEKLDQLCKSVVLVQQEMNELSKIRDQSGTDRTEQIEEEVKKTLQGAESTQKLFVEKSISILQKIRESQFNLTQHLTELVRGATDDLHIHCTGIYVLHRQPEYRLVVHHKWNQRTVRSEWYRAAGFLIREKMEMCSDQNVPASEQDYQITSREEHEWMQEKVKYQEAWFGCTSNILWSNRNQSAPIPPCEQCIASLTKPNAIHDVKTCIHRRKTQELLLQFMEAYENREATRLRMLKID